MASVLHDALVEIDAALAALAPIQEGDRDFDRLNVLDPTRAAVLADLVIIDRRMATLTSARAAIVTLLDDGYPELPPPAVTPEVLTDMAAQLSTLTAAQTRFSPPARKGR